jgi:hypothetical protein
MQRYLIKTSVFPIFVSSFSFFCSIDMSHVLIILPTNILVQKLALGRQFIMLQSRLLDFRIRSQRGAGYGIVASLIEFFINW